MTRFAVLAVVVSTLFAGTAEAQVASSSSSSRASLLLADQRELRAIEGSAETARVFYGVGVFTHVAGASLLAGSLLFSVRISLSPTSDPPRVPLELALTGGAMAFVGLVVLFTGIGFDADSGRRRNLLRARYPGVDLSVAPTEGGAYAAVLARF